MKILWVVAWIGFVATLGAEGALPLGQPAASRVALRSDPLDTLYVIPAGPVAGGFTQESRIQVIDTIAGWAKILVEGWTPASNLRWNSEPIRFGSIAVSEAGTTKQASQCTGITKKGKRCKRAAKPGSTRCWQHPQ